MAVLYYRDPADQQYKPLSFGSGGGGGAGAEVEVIISSTQPTDPLNELWVDTTQDTIPSGTIPVGAIMAWAGAIAPNGWQLCDGTLLMRIQYHALFAAIGVTYGIGDGVTTFATPNLAGKVIVASGGGFTLNTSGGSTTISTSDMPVHNHGVSDPGHAHSVADPGHWHWAIGEYTRNPVILSAHKLEDTPNQGRSYLRDDSGVSGGYGLITDTRGTGIGIYGAGTGITTQNAGSGAANGKMPPFMVLNYIIKT